MGVSTFPFGVNGFLDVVSYHLFVNLQDQARKFVHILEHFPEILAPTQISGPTERDSFIMDSFLKNFLVFIRPRAVASRVA